MTNRLAARLSRLVFRPFLPTVGSSTAGPGVAAYPERDYAKVRESVLAALIARTSASLAVVTFCVTVCGLGAWLAVGWPGTHFLSADTRSMLAADYGPDQHVLTQPPLDTTITQAAQDDVGSSPQA